MRRKSNVIKHLVMMGYIVTDDPIMQGIEVKIRMDSGLYIKTVLHYRDIDQDYIIEETVALINSYIIKGF